MKDVSVAAAPFRRKTFGKWILVGEHAVLRGVPALVFPTTAFGMNFSWQPSATPLKVNFQGSRGEELNLIFWGLIEHALQKTGRARAQLTGELTIESELPLGAGLGASGALCVGVGRLFAHWGFVGHDDIWSKRSDPIYEFSRELENLFHGQSSGVDIAVALEGRGLRFMRGGERSPVTVNWAPKIYLSYSGKRGMTSDCVRRVCDLRERSPHLGEKLDLQMREAVEVAEKALQADAQSGLDLLSRAFDLGRDCFYQWGLCEGPLDQHMRELIQAGALAVKPTGSGGGGYVISLWENAPPTLPFALFSANLNSTES
jgi:mevalonate kinase